MKIAAFMLLLGFCSSAYAGTVLFSDNFNRANLNPDANNPIWVGKSGLSDLNGVIADQALTFTQTNLGGDAFTSKAFDVQAGQFYELKFDYRGAERGAGFIGLSTGTPDNHIWLAGTEQAYLGNSGLPLTTIPGDAASRVLQNDGQWHSYSILFQSSADRSLRVMIEDFSLQPGITDPKAFFDNVQVAAVPVPAAAWIGSALMGALGLVRVMRRR